MVEGAGGVTEVASAPNSLRAAVEALETSGGSRKDAIVEIARRAGIPKRAVYQAVHVSGKEPK